MKERILTTLLLAFSLLVCIPAPAQESYSYRTQQQDSAQRRNFPQRRLPHRESSKTIIDSLTRVIEALRQELYMRDSLESEMVEIIEEEAAEIPEGSYTAEMTDSLLNMWYLQSQISRNSDF